MNAACPRRGARSNRAAPISAGPAAGSLELAGGSPPPRMGLSKRQRLRISSAFREAFEHGKPFVGKYMVMRQRRGEGAALRLGLIIGKRTMPRATDRSRARRLLREAYRLNRHRFRADCDVVLIGRRPLAGACMAEAERDLLRLAKQSGLLP